MRMRGCDVICTAPAALHVVGVASSMEGLALIDAEGLNKRCNSVLCSSPASPDRHVVFFQGDTQDMKASMESQYEEISRWKDWCLENTCHLLCKRFPDAAVWVVRPARMLRCQFSCFSHFVDCGLTGVPEYSGREPLRALPHLQLMLGSAVHQWRALNKSTTGKQQQATDKVKVNGGSPAGTGAEMEEERLLALPVVLVGFSKGCVVLNQVVHELGTLLDPKSKSSPAPESHDCKEDLRQFASRIEEFYWLDSGHSGEHGAWVTEPKLLQALVRLKVKVHVHVTPLQVKCPSRPWLGEEERVFVDQLAAMGGQVEEKLHFEDEMSLESHFRVLNVF